MSTITQPDLRDTVLYDGHCRFCTASIDTLRRLDGRGRLRYLSLHDPSVANDFPDLSSDQMMKEMWIGTRDGRRYRVLMPSSISRENFQYCIRLPRSCTSLV